MHKIGNSSEPAVEHRELSPALFGDLNGKEIQKRGDICIPMGFPGGSDSKESACNVGHPGSIPGLRGSPGKGNGSSASVLAGESHGQRSLAGYSPWGPKG